MSAIGYNGYIYSSSLTIELVMDNFGTDTIINEKLHIRIKELFELLQVDRKDIACKILISEEQ